MVKNSSGKHKVVLDEAQEKCSNQHIVIPRERSDEESLKYIKHQELFYCTFLKKVPKTRGVAIRPGPLTLHKCGMLRLIQISEILNLVH